MYSTASIHRALREAGVRRRWAVEHNARRIVREAIRQTCLAEHALRASSVEYSPLLYLTEMIRQALRFRGFSGLMHQEHGTLNSVHSSCSNPHNGPVGVQARRQTSAVLPLVRRDAWKSALCGGEPSLTRPEETSMEPRHTGPRRCVFSALPLSSAPAKRYTTASLRMARPS